MNVTPARLRRCQLRFLDSVLNRLTELFDDPRVLD